MTLELYADTPVIIGQSWSVLSAAYTAGDTALAVVSNAPYPAADPTLNPATVFRVRVDNEILLVTDNRTLAWVVAGAQEGSTAADHAAGALVVVPFTKGSVAGVLAAAATDATTKANAAQAASQPVDSDLTAIAALTTTSFGRALLALADAAAGRTVLGLGTAATQTSTAFDAAGLAAAAQAASQPVDTDLTAIAALTTTAYGRAFLALADAAAARTALALGTIATHDATEFLTTTAASATYATLTRAAKQRLRSVANERRTLQLTAAESPTVTFFLGNTSNYAAFATDIYTTSRVRHFGGYPQLRVASGSNFYENAVSGNGNKMPWFHSYLTQAVSFEHLFDALATPTSFRIYVDGLPIAAATVTANGTYLTGGIIQTSGLTPGSRYRMRLAFATRRIRRITIEENNGPFYGVNMQTGDMLGSTEVQSACKALWGCLDSWGAGTGATDALNSFSVLARRLLGIDDMAIDAQGGTGYVNPGNPALNADTFVNRMSTALDRITTPDLILLGPSGRNDSAAAGFSPAAVGAAVTQVMATCATKAPNAVIVAAGLNKNTDTVDADLDAVAAAIKTAYLAAPNLTAFIDPLTGDVLGPGGSTIRSAGGAWITAATNANLITAGGAAAGHPTDDGHAALAQLMASGVNSALIPA